MKTLKTLFVLLLLTISMAASAQTTLKEAFKAYIQANPSATNMNPTTMRMALELMNKGIIKDYDEAQSGELIDKYLKDQFWDDAIDAMLPFVEDKLKVNELNQLTSMLLSKKGKSYAEHWAQVNENSDFEQMGIDIATKLVSGEDLAPVEPIACPAKYKKLFYEFYEASGQKELLNPMFESLTSATVSEQKATLNQLKTYIMDNIPTIILNRSYGVLTKNDMKFGTKLFKSQAWKNQMNAMQGVLSNSQEMGMSIVMNYLAWLQDQGIETNM